MFYLVNIFLMATLSWFVLGQLQVGEKLQVDTKRKCMRSICCYWKFCWHSMLQYNQYYIIRCGWCSEKKKINAKKKY